MNELIQTLLGVLRALLRFRWTILIVATLVSLAGWAHVHRMQDVYVAQARVFVDSNRVLGPLLQGLAVQSNVEQRVSLMSRTLLNRPNLEKLIRDTDLDVTASTELERERLLNDVRERLSLTGSRSNASLYSVSYRDSQRLRAKRVVQALLTVFIEETIGDTREDSTTAQEFLDRQIVDLERRLASAEKRLSDFKRENAGLTPGESGGYYARLATVTAQSREARLALAEATNRRDLLARSLSRESPTLRGEEGVAGASPAALKLQAQRDELDDFLVRYTERHPRVSQLRASIASLEAQVAAEGDAPGSRRAGPVIASPAYQEMRAALTEAEAEVAGLEVRVADYEEQVRELEATVESIPAIEARLADLDRDYGIVQEQYQTLLQRRESARLSEQVEQNVDDIQFRVIDPPFVPVRPTAPNKGLLSAAVFVAGLGAGGALAFALSLLRPVYYSPADVAARSGRTALGSVSVWRDARARTLIKLSWITWLAALGALGLACLLIVAFQRNIIDVATLTRLTGLPLGDWLWSLGAASDRAVELVEGLLGRGGS